MQTFVEKQYEKEQGYIWNHHLGGAIQLLSKFKATDDPKTESCDAKLLGKKYKVYKNDVTGIILIPNDITDFSDDFGPVIQYYANPNKKDDFFFTSCKRTNGVVERINYSFGGNAKEAHVVCRFATFNDENNDLQKQYLENNLSLVSFVTLSGHFMATPDPKEYTVKVLRNKKNTKWNAGVFTLDEMSLDDLEDYFEYPNEASSNRTPMIKLAEKIYGKKQSEMLSVQKKKA